MRVLKKPRISDVSALKLALVSAAYCFQSTPHKKSSDDDDLEEEVHALACTTSTRLVFSSQEGNESSNEEQEIFGSGVDDDGSLHVVVRILGK